MKYTGMTDDNESRMEISDMGDASRDMSKIGSDNIKI